VGRSVRRPGAMPPTRELTPQDEARIASRVHPLGAPLPVLDYEPPLFRTMGAEAHTTLLGVRTEWKSKPDTYPCEKLSLYSWSFRDCLAVDGRTFCPGVSCFWNDSRPNRKGKRWSVKLLAVATEHVGRVLHLPPALMVRLYNGELAFALPAEVEL
jgi:hypothetical protein